MKRVGWAAAIGFATGVIGLAASLVPPVAALEDTLGLRSLFFVRGPVPPPRDVAIVSIDESTAAAMNLPAAIREWPRSVHSDLVDRLVERGASVIAFDVQFFRHGATGADEDFAAAIARARRVVLAQRLELVTAGDIQMWERQDPIPLLANAAVGLAPVLVPDTPLVSWIWSFIPTRHAGEVPALPSVMLQTHALPFFEPMLDIMHDAGVNGLEALPRSADMRDPDDLISVIRSIREHVGVDAPAVRERASTLITAREHELGPQKARAIRALVDLYVSSGTRYLNFYGPPGTVCTVPYEVVLTGSSAPKECSFDGALVLVGLGNARLPRAGQVDTYHTVYGGHEGIDFSGVELHATALANLLTGTTLRPMERRVAVATLMLSGAVVGATGYWVRTRRRREKAAVVSRIEATAVMLGVALVYCVLVYWLFRERLVIMPMIVPLAFQLPGAVIFSLLVPAARHKEQVRAICLATDASGSTAIGQRVPHPRFTQLMSDYLETLRRTVVACGGEPLPPKGDGFVSIWRIPEMSPTSRGADQAIRLQAWKAALEMAAAADRFNLQQAEDLKLPTRIGLNIGTVTVHSNADRGVYELFGDAVNVVSRLCDLNKTVCTRVLASNDVVVGLEASFAFRKLGAIALDGVSRPVTVFEVLDDVSARVPTQRVSSL